MHGKPITELRSVICHICDDTVLPADLLPDTGERAPDIPVLDLRVPTPEGWKAEFTLVLDIQRCFDCPQTDTHLSRPTNRLTAATRQGIEPTTWRSQAQRFNR